MFRYKVHFLNEVINEEDSDSGFVSGKTYGEAADKVVEYFGRDSICDLYLIEYEEVISDTDIEALIN